MIFEGGGDGGYERFRQFHRETTQLEDPGLQEVLSAFYAGEQFRGLHFGIDEGYAALAHLCHRQGAEGQIRARAMIEKAHCNLRGSDCPRCRVLFFMAGHKLETGNPSGAFADARGICVRKGNKQDEDLRAQLFENIAKALIKAGALDEARLVLQNLPRDDHSLMEQRDRMAFVLIAANLARGKREAACEIFAKETRFGASAHHYPVVFAALKENRTPSK